MAKLIEMGRTEEAKNALDKINMLARRMAITSKHLKSLARRPEKKAGRADLKKTLKQAIDLFEEQIKTHHIDLEIKQPGEEIMVVGEEIPLEQVFTNLISNAMDAMDGQPEKKLTIDIFFQEDPGEIHIEFRDTGKGIDKEELNQIFDPFYTSKEVGDGLGLGLSISYNIVKDWDGALQARSTPGRGSCFLLILKTH